MKDEAYSFEMSDVRIDTWRMSAYVNKADSAVRVTHLPTGFKAESCIFMGHHRNRREALRKLSDIISKEFGSWPRKLNSQG